MIIPNLHKQMVALDRNLHRNLRIHQPEMDWSMTAALNAVFVVGAEFGDVSREYPILFVRAGNGPDGKPMAASIAALGLAQQENLFLDGTRWRGQYVPALLRSYPFGIGRIGAEQRAVMSIDIGWSGLSQTEGVPLFDAEGQPSEHLKTMNQQLEQLETEVQRTRELCRILLEKELLRDMRFDAELPDGSKLKVDGFLMVDEQRLAGLPDAEVLAMHRSGVLGLIHAHFISMGNMRKMVQWRLDRQAALQAAAAAVAPS